MSTVLPRPTDTAEAPAAAARAAVLADGLNAQQLAAVQHGETPLLVLAGAGTGKTLTLASRVARLVLDGADPNRLLLLTFSRRAAQQMQQRAGRLLHRGASAPLLLALGFATMAVAGALAFAPLGQPAWQRYAAVLAFSMVGGMVPATLFALVVRLAPGEHTLSSTMGWMQQWSALGQFAGPPLVAWLASRAGGWQLTWLVTGGAAVLGGLLSRRIARLLAR